MKEQGEKVPRSLIVTADDSSNSTLYDTLCRHGLFVSTCRDIRSAIRLFKNQPFQLVWLDIDMESHEIGLLCRRLRALPGGEDCHVVSVLADLASNRSVDDLPDCVDDFLGKPIRPGELSARLQAYEAQRSRMESSRTLERRLIMLDTEELDRLGQRIHDSLGQSLTGVAFMLKVIERKLQRGIIVDQADVQEIGETVAGAIEQAREISHGLNPISSAADSLQALLRDMGKSIEIEYSSHCVVDCENDIGFYNNFVATQLYRIAATAARGFAKAASTTEIRIQVKRVGSEVELDVQGSWGRRDVESTAEQQQDLELIRARARSIGANIYLSTMPDGGARIVCKPLAGPNPEVMQQGTA